MDEGTIVWDWQHCDSRSSDLMRQDSNGSDLLQ